MTHTPYMDRMVEIGARAISPNAHEPWLDPVRRALTAIALSSRVEQPPVASQPPATPPGDPHVMEAGDVKVSGYGRVGMTAPGVSERQQNIIDREARSRRIDPVSTSLGTTELGDAEPAKKPRPDADKAAALKMARDMGFSGDICVSCGSPNMKRNGSCLVCSDCGSTTGCS